MGRGETPPEMDLFLEALEKEGKDRQAFLDEQGLDDAARTRLEELLSAHERAEAREDPNASVGRDFGEGMVGREVQGYRLEKLIARGGVGAVFLARQSQPNRLVAIKFLSFWLTSSRLKSRFRNEAEILARLNHHGIAKVFEAGTTDFGFGSQPFFAMEYIDGCSLTSHARRESMSVSQRLELMIEVCEAITHAHQRGVTHCDLKPDNVLVDSAGTPKVLDFGISRLTEADPSSLHRTRPGEILGTLAYMSPEQVSGDSSQIDTRSDIYALGVMTFELLTGHLPLDLDAQSLTASLEMIVHREPKRLDSFSASFRGDLQTIVSKSMAKEKEARYATAEAFAEDLRRFLHHQPILARTPSGLYHLRKFTRRNRALSSTLALFAVSLIAGIISLGVLLERAKRAEASAREESHAARRAEASERKERKAARRAEEAERQERKVARRHAEVLDEVNTFFVDQILQQAAPDRMGRKATIRDAVDRAAALVSERFERNSAVRGAIHSSVGRIYTVFEEFDDAFVHLDAAIALRDDQDQNQTTALRKDRLNLAKVYEAKGQYDRAERYLLDLGAEDEDLSASDHTQRAAVGLLARMRRLQGRFEECEALYLRALAVDPGEDPEHRRAHFLRRQGLCSLYHSLNRLKEAEALLRKNLEEQRSLLGHEHFDTLYTLNGLGLVLKDSSRFEEAETMLKESLSIGRRLLGGGHTHTIAALHNLALVYDDQSRFEDSIPIFEEVLGLMIEHVGEDHHEVWNVKHNLGAALERMNRFEEAEGYLVDAYESQLEEFGDDHLSTLITKNSLARAFIGLGQYEDAEELTLEVLDAIEAEFGKTHSFTRRVASTLYRLYQTQGRIADAQDVSARYGGSR